MFIIFVVEDNQTLKDLIERYGICKRFNYLLKQTPQG